MEKNQTEKDILGMKESRFSGEERARMAEENAFARNSSKRNNEKRSGKTSHSEKNKSSSVQKRPSSVSKEKTATDNGGRSRNERVRSSSVQRKKEKKRQNNLIIAMMFVIVISLVGVLAVVVLKINTVEVTGTEYYSSRSVLTAAGLSEGDSMVLINERAMEAKIEMLLPYVENADIKREWPDKVTVTLEDAVATLAVDTGEGYILMNNSCKILDEDAAALGTKCALIKGVTLSEATAGTKAVFDGDISTEDFVSLTSAFEENGIDKISEYDLSVISNISVTIDHRIEVKLGTLAGAAEKFAFGQKVIEETIASDEKHAIVIDITTDGTAYVRQKDDNNAVFGEEDDTTEQSVSEAVTDNSANITETTGISVG